MSNGPIRLRGSGASGPSGAAYLRFGYAVFGNQFPGTRNQAAGERVIAGRPLGNGAAIFASDGGLARRFVNEVEAGQVGVNVPIPFPVFFHNFAGWKDSAFTETKLFGPDAIAFHTRTKTVSARWPDANASKVDLAFPRPN